MIKKVAVYLGSRSGNRKAFGRFAYKLGFYLASQGIDVIYGGACVGTMKSLSDGVKDGGGRITGVFPKGFQGRKENSMKGIEVRENGIEDMIEVESLNVRIETMNHMSDACLVLPGSFGTMNELFQYAVGLQLGMHNKPVHIINMDGYYLPLKQLVENFIENGFMPSSDRDLLVFHEVCGKDYED